MRSFMHALIALLILAAASGCAPKVAYHVRNFQRFGAVKGSCSQQGAQQRVSFAITDRWVFLGPVEVSAAAPRPLPRAGWQGPATITSRDLDGVSETSATWRVVKDRTCVVVEGMEIIPHIADSAPRAADGRLLRGTYEYVRLGPWCTTRCELEPVARSAEREAPSAL